MIVRRAADGVGVFVRMSQGGFVGLSAVDVPRRRDDYTELWIYQIAVI